MAFLSFLTGFTCGFELHAFFTETRHKHRAELEHSVGRRYQQCWQQFWRDRQWQTLYFLKDVCISVSCAKRQRRSTPILSFQDILEQKNIRFCGNFWIKEGFCKKDFSEVNLQSILRFQQGLLNDCS